MDFVVITGLALIFLLLSWLYGRLVSSGQPLNTFKKTVLVYAFIFVLGMGYLMALVADLHWPKDLLFPVVILWGGVVGFVAWVRRRREKRASKESI
jgi:predicted tellurium resistance membrane protein TerC